MLVWPPALPAGLAGLYVEVAQRLGDLEVKMLGSLTEVADQRSEIPGADAVVVVVDAALVTAQPDPSGVLDGLRALVDEDGLDVVAVVGDGFLGTDVDEVAPAMAAAAAVTIVRSMAVRRGGSGRSNVVCVPAAMFDTEGSQRGPLAARPVTGDVADAVAFLLDEQAGYVTGQVLFVNGGRHLFSSLSA